MNQIDKIKINYLQGVSLNKEEEQTLKDYLFLYAKRITGDNWRVKYINEPNIDKLLDDMLEEDIDPF